jgi:excisionase family DNA binding protein
LARGLPSVFTSEEVAALFRVSRQRVERWVRAEKIAAHRLVGTRSYRFVPEEICKHFGVSKAKLTEMWHRTGRNGNGNEK